MLDLNRAAVFVRVVEAGGFTAAGNRLGLPTSSVSRAVAALERDLGVVLLERTTRRVGVTDAGRAYFERARDALAGLDEATALAVDAAQAPHGLVRLAAPPSMTPSLAPLLATMLAAHPGMQVEVVGSYRAGDLVMAGVADLGIALGRQADSGLTTRKLGDGVSQLFAAPGYLAARGRPRRVSDLAAHDAVVFGDAVAARWQLRSPAGEESVRPIVRLASDHLDLVHAAALAGVGIALLPTFQAAADVRRGELAPVLPEHAEASALALLCHPSRHLPHRVALLRDAMLAAIPTQCRAHATGAAASPRPRSPRPRRA